MKQKHLHMKTRPDLNKLAKEVFEANKAKGFHNPVESDETYLMLVITELSEAVDADRKGKRADMKMYQHCCEVWKKQYPNKEMKLFVQDFEAYVKDTIEDELADAVIRLLDLAGLREIEISNSEEDIDTEELEGAPFAGVVFSIVSCISENYRSIFGIQTEKVIPLGIDLIEAYCKHLTMDLWLHVELKMQYNQTRPLKHGKSY